MLLFNDLTDSFQKGKGEESVESRSKALKQMLI